MKTTISLFGIIFILNVVVSVKITSLKMPSPYILFNSARSNENRPLVLDCVYDTSGNEQGLVLKWYFNQQLIYQWIPGAKKSPSSMNLFKNRISSVKNKYRAIEILNPTINISGIYSCSVQTFQSIDIKFETLYIIVPESAFYVTYEIEDNLVHIQCQCINIYPEPIIRIFIENAFNELDVIETVLTNTDNQLKNVTVEGRVHRKQLKSPTSFFCVLSLGVYVKKLQTIFHDTDPSEEQQPYCSQKDAFGNQVKIWRINSGSPSISTTMAFQIQSIIWIFEFLVEN